MSIHCKQGLWRRRNAKVKDIGHIHIIELTCSICDGAMSMLLTLMTELTLPITVTKPLLFFTTKSSVP